MIRGSLGLALGALLVLLGPGSAQAGRCPFCAQAQMSLQIQWQMAMMRQQSAWGARSTGWGGHGATWGARSTSWGGRNAGWGRRQTFSTHSTRMFTTRKNIFATRRVTTHSRRSWSTHSRLVPHRHGIGWGRHTTRTVTRHHHWTRTTRTTHLHRHLSRITQRHRTVRRHTNVTRQRWSTNRRRIQGQARRRTSAPRPRSQANAGRKNRTAQRHRPTVRLRVSVTNTCGSCHQCKQNKQPTIVRQPNLPSFPARRPDLVPGRPWRPVGPGPGPVVRLPDPRVRPMVGPRPVLPGFVTQKPGPVLRPITTLEPPSLPPLGITRTSGPRRPLLEPLTIDKRDSSDRPERGPSIGEEMAHGKPVVEASPPPLPVLEGGVAQLSPLLDDSQPESRAHGAAARTSLSPDQVVQAPAFSALPGLRPHQRLLPNLDDDEDDGPSPGPAARPLLVELVLRPPPLPPLPEMALP